MLRKVIKGVTPDFIIEKYRSWKYYKCPICSAYASKFLPLYPSYFETAKKYGFIYSFYDFETLNCDNYRCPSCEASDRDRLYVIYLERYFSKHFQKVDLIDFAPTPQLSSWLRKQKHINYRSADLYMDNVDDKVDITNMLIYQNEQFDIFICSHVLEHVIDADAAMRELYRITKKGGWGIVMVPLIRGLEETQENPEHTTEAERWRYYGQEDHLRMFGKADFISRLEKVGFKVLQFGADFFGKRKIKKAAISPSSVLYIARK